MTDNPYSEVGVPQKSGVVLDKLVMKFDTFLICYDILKRKQMPVFHVEWEWERSVAKPTPVYNVISGKAIQDLPVWANVDKWLLGFQFQGLPKPIAINISNPIYAPK